MAQIFNIPNPLTPAQIAAIEANLDAIKVILDGAAISISKSQTRSMIKVSTMREALIKDVDEKLLAGFPKVIPATFTIADFEAQIAYRSVLKGLLAVANSRAVSINTLLRIISNNVMMETTMILDSSRAIATYDSDLSQTVSDLSAKHFRSQPGKKKATTYTFTSKTVITLHNVIPGKVLTNRSMYMISILNVDGNYLDTLQINPFSGVKIPKGWTNIVVTNMSADGEAIVDVFIDNAA